MNVLLLVSAILQALAMAGRNPALGFDGSKYADMLELLARLVERGNVAADELRKLRAEVEQMLIEGRSPTDGEMAAWKARSDSAHAALQAMKDRAPDPTMDDDDGTRGDAG